MPLTSKFRRGMPEACFQLLKENTPEWRRIGGGGGGGIGSQKRTAKGVESKLHPEGNLLFRMKERVNIRKL